MTEEKFIHTNLKNELTYDFLVEILKHYHYEQKDMEMLKEVAGELRECLAGEEGFYCMTRRQCEQILNLCREENYAIGIFTLGSRVDELCLLYTSDAADELDGVDLGGRRIIKKKFFQAEDGIRDQPRSRGLGDVYKRQRGGLRRKYPFRS